MTSTHKAWKQEKKNVYTMFLCKSKRMKVLILAALITINVLLVTWIFLVPEWWLKLVTSAQTKEGDSESMLSLSSSIFIASRPTFGYDVIIEAKSEASVVVNATTNGNMKPPISNSKTAGGCLNILHEMTSGHWVTQPLTSDEQRIIDDYLTSARVAFHIPSTLQRRDERCGDVPYEDSPLYRHMWFKAICNPKGDKPCCKNNSCESLSVEECRCPSCYDERPAIHAEFATWHPENEACQVKTYSPPQACQLLKGAKLFFIGDSFVRHLFAAVAIVLTGNTIDGALRKSSVHYNRNCLGMHQFTGLRCKTLLDDDRFVCNGTVHLKYIEVFSSKQLPQSIPFLKSLSGDKKSLMVMGFGIHDDFRDNTVKKSFLTPFLNIHRWLFMHPNDTNSISEAVMNYSSPFINNLSSLYDFDNIKKMLLDLGLNSSSIGDLKYKYGFALKEPASSNDTRISYVRTHANPLVFHEIPGNFTEMARISPRLLWIGIHAPGVLKSPKYSQQTYKGVLSFNQEIAKYLHKWDIPYLDTLSFSKGTVSYDGTHYGWGINMLKVNMILTYTQTELGSDNAWAQ